MNAFNLALIMFLLMVTGYITRKSKLVDEKFGQSLSVFLFNIVFPAIIISSMSIEFDRNDMRNSIILITISVVTTVVMFITAKTANKITGKNDSISRIINFAMMFPNFTFMAFPVMETLFPDKGLFYISMYTIPTRFLIYIIGPMVIKEDNEVLGKMQFLKNSIRSILTPPVIAIPIGFFIYFSGFSLPVFIGDTLKHISNTATPMGMILSGIVLAEAALGNMLKEKRLYLLAFLRLILAPVLTYFIILPFGFDPVIVKISVIYSALPIASSTTVFALKYGKNPQSAAAGVFLTTIISILTIPLCAYILEFVV